MTELTDLLTQLEAIAAANNDQFAYRIEIEPRHRVMFLFVCEEKTEKATFVSGNGATIEDACRNAAEWVSQKSQEWGYA